MGGQDGISFAAWVDDPKLGRLTASNLTLFGRKQTIAGSRKKLMAIVRSVQTRFSSSFFGSMKIFKGEDIFRDES